MDGRECRTNGVIEYPECYGGPGTIGVQVARWAHKAADLCGSVLIAGSVWPERTYSRNFVLSG